MPQMIFVNLPVSDVARARAFYEGVGFTINPQFSDENANCVVVSETIYIMTLRRDFFAGFAPRPVADPRTTTGALIALSRQSRDEVDAFVAAALMLGGTEPKPAADHGFMYQRTIADPDGNIFEPFWMDPAAVAG
jgi:predicted lactoylglutathione lyase